jgi:hypothetical protein
MKKKIRKIIIGALASISLLAIVNAAQVSTPVSRTFVNNDLTSTNDFVFAQKGDLRYSFEPDYYRIQVRGNNYFSWPLLEFSDLGSNAAVNRNFTMESKIAASGDYKICIGFTALCLNTTPASSTESSYYAAYVRPTDVQGTNYSFNIVKYVNAIEENLTNITIRSNFPSTWNLKLDGTYDKDALTIKLTGYPIAGGETNTLEFVDSGPLNGSFFGFFGYDYYGQYPYMYLYDLKVDSSDIKIPGTVFMIQ